MHKNYSILVLIVLIFIGTNPSLADHNAELLPKAIKMKHSLIESEFRRSNYLLFSIVKIVSPYAEPVKLKSFGFLGFVFVLSDGGIDQNNQAVDSAAVAPIVVPSDGERDYTYPETDTTAVDPSQILQN